MLSLQLTKINKHYGSVHVLKDVSLEVEQGEFVVFVGPSGCGKSTLLRTIAGLEEATSGDLFIEGQRVNDKDASDRGVAMVFQSYALYPHMTVRENLSFGLENIRMPKAEINDRVGRAAALLQIDPLLERRPKELSGGQRQRVAIGRAITRDPKIFLFDEPLSNLDAELRVQMRMEITQLHERLKNTMIYVTHDQIEAMTMADKIVVLRAGVVEQVGAPLELYNNPLNIFVAGFIGSPRMNFIKGELQDSFEGPVFTSPSTVSYPLGQIVSGASRDVTFGVRPEHFDLMGEGQGWEVKVLMVEQYGSSSYIHGQLTNGTELLVHQEGQSVLKRGDLLRVLPRQGHWHLFNDTGLRLPEFR